MSHSLRMSEKIYNRLLWIVALVFAYFLCGLGASLVGDLPKVEHQRTREELMDVHLSTRLKEKIEAARKSSEAAQTAQEAAQLKAQATQADYEAARETFENWLKTRHATANPNQDDELVERTAQLEKLRVAARSAQSIVEAHQQTILQARTTQDNAQTQLSQMQEKADVELQTIYRRQELNVFFYRLALTLPLLALAAFLFVKQRKNRYWPFVWGYIFFALFTFFVELVPYLPSYGGYVRYSVGIILTLVIGRYAIIALNNYLEKQKQAEQLPETQRKKELSYDLALARLSKSICPGCERPIDIKDERQNFCSHCGLRMFENCKQCQVRKSAFTKFCFACGAAQASMTSEK